MSTLKLDTSNEELSREKVRGEAYKKLCESDVTQWFKDAYPLVGGHVGHKAELD